MLFISYSRKDSEIAEHHAYVWRAAGQNAFLDEHSLQPGEDYKQQIADTIQKADRLMLFWSKSAANSTHVADEWRLALVTPTCKIVPVLIDDTPLPNELQHLHGVASLGRMFRLARSRDVFGTWLKRLTQAVILLTMIAVPAWLFLSDGQSEHLFSKEHARGQRGIVLNAEPSALHTLLFGKEPSLASSVFTLARHMLLNIALPALVATVIYTFVVTRYRQMQLRREIQRHARDAITNSANGKHPPHTMDPRGESS